LVRDVIEQFKPKLLHVETVKCTRWLTENYLPGLVISNKSRLDIGLSVLFPVSTVFILPRTDPVPSTNTLLLVVVIVLPCTSCDKTRSLAKWLNLSCQNGCVTKPGHPSLTNKKQMMNYTGEFNCYLWYYHCTYLII
jgi:hypothetical protein